MSEAQPSLPERLRAVLGAEGVGAGEAALAAHALDGLRPQAVAYPETHEQVAALLALAAAQRWAVVPWGSGSGMERGRPPARYDVAVAMGRLAKVHDHDVENLTLTADAGVTLAEANRHVSARHQMLPIGHLDAPHTLGGILAANRPAPRRLLHGEVRDQLLGLRVALADGTLVRYGRKVLKNVAGYDMNKLFLGSQGLLGIVVEATFKLAALPDEEGCLLAHFAGAEEASQAAAALYGSQLLPGLLHLLDADSAAQFRAPEAGRAEGLWLLVGFEGRAAALQRQRADAESLLRGHGARSVAQLGSLTGAQRQVLDAPAAIPGDAAPVRVRLGTVPSAVPSRMADARRMATELGQPAAVVADYAAGQVQLALTPAQDESGMQRMAAALEAMRAALAPTRGWLTLESAPTTLKSSVEPLGITASEAHLMGLLKRRFDPGDVLVPGRFLPTAGQA